MLIFQTSKNKDRPVSHLWDLTTSVPIKSYDQSQWYAETSATYSTKKKSGSVGMTYITKDKNGSIKVSYVFDSKEEADKWYRQFGLTANIILPKGTVGVFAKLDKTVELQITANSGYSVYISKQLDQILGGGKPTFKVSFKGVVGDIYSIAGLFAGVETPINAVFGAVDLVSDLLYSIFSGVKDIIWPSRAPDETALAHVRDGTASIRECVQVLRYKGEIPDRELAGSQLELLLLEDIGGALLGKKSKLSLGDWDNLLPILENNRFAKTEKGMVRLVTSTGLAQIRQHVDVWRMIDAGEIKPLGGLVTDTILPVAGALFGIDQQKVKDAFTLTQLKFGKPLNLRWHGWNVPATIGDTMLGWFEGLWSFENAKNADSFLGTIIGGALDLLNGAISIPGKIIGSILPVFRTSDGRKMQVEDGIRDAMRTNERLIAKMDMGVKLKEEERTLLYEHMLYLSQMLPFLKNSSQGELAMEVEGHRKKHGMIYEVLYARMTHVEIDAMVSDLESGKYKDKGGRMETLRNSIMGNLNQALIRLAQSYAYINRESSDAKAFAKLPSYLQREAALQIVGTEKLFESIEKKKLITYEDGKSVPWSEQIADLSSIVKDLKNGSLYSGYWRIAQDVLLSGRADFSKDPKDWGLDENEHQAVSKIVDLFYYADIYPVLRGYLAGWAPKQPSKNALLVAGRLVKEMEKYKGRGEEKQQSLKGVLDWLVLVGTLYPANGHGQKVGSAVEQALEKHLEEIAKDADEVKGNARQDYIKSLGLVEFAYYRLQVSGALTRDYSESLVDRLREATGTLYGIWDGAKDNNVKGMAWDLLFETYFRFGAGMFGEIGEKEFAALEKKIKEKLASMQANK